MKNNFIQDINEKGFLKALKEDLFSPRTAQLLCIALAVAVLFFFLGVKAECERAGGWLGFQNSFGTKWECYERENPVNIYDDSILSRLNITVRTNVPDGNISFNEG